jgi:hypothetical protein
MDLFNDSTSLPNDAPLTKWPSRTSLDMSYSGTYEVNPDIDQISQAWFEEKSRFEAIYSSALRSRETSLSTQTLSSRDDYLQINVLLTMEWITQPYHTGGSSADFHFVVDMGLDLSPLHFTPLPQVRSNTLPHLSEPHLSQLSDSFVYLEDDV